MDGELKTVGKSIPVVDGMEKVTGKARYGVDMVLPGMLHGKILRSPHPHARIIHIDTEEARRYPGVHTIITAMDAPDGLFGLNYPDERFFARDEVHYIGDEVAAVAAVDEKTAAAALELIKVEYQPLPAVFDILEASADEAPRVRSDQNSNVNCQPVINRGDIEKGFQEADIIYEKTFHLPHQYHAFLEPHTATAEWNNQRLTIWAPHQAPRHLEAVISKAFNLPPGGFRFIQTHIGGGFGGKTHMRTPLFAALLAKHSGTAVRLTQTRKEDFEAAMPAVPMVIRVKMGVRKDGTISAKEMDLTADNGAFTACGLAVLGDATIAIDNLYHFENLRTSSRLVYTNKVGASGFRGFGNPQITFAIESMMDTMANKLGMDAAEFRLRNAIQSGETSPHGWKIKSCGFSDAIHLAVEHSGWKKKRSQMRNKHRGIGMACAIHKSGTSVVPPLGSTAIVSIHEDGSVHVSSSEGDSGQGAKTVFAQIAAEELGISHEQVIVEELDTDKTNFSSGVIGSRVTFMGGNAVKDAAASAAKQLVKAAANFWQCDVNQVHLFKGQLINSNSEESMSFQQAAMIFFESNGGSRIHANGKFLSQDVVIPEKEYGNVSQAYPFAVHVAEVEVDIETGSVTVLNYTAVHDAGQVINPMAAEGQIEGALLMGLGYALTEEFIFSDNGKILNDNFTNFHIPTSMDFPKSKVLFTKTRDDFGPFGAKSIGEIALVPVAPAITNAIFDATGIQPERIPVSPERLYKAIRMEKGNQHY